MWTGQWAVENPLYHDNIGQLEQDLLPSLPPAHWVEPKKSVSVYQALSIPYCIQNKYTLKHLTGDHLAGREGVGQYRSEGQITKGQYETVYKVQRLYQHRHHP